MSEASLKLVDSADGIGGSGQEAKNPRRPRRLRQFPSYNLEQTLQIALAIASYNACKPFSRLSLAESVGRSPDSSQFRTLITSSSAYGLTQGGYQAPQISLTPLGLSIVAPRSDEERRRSLVDAALMVDLFQRLYKHFDQHRVPPAENFRNTLIRDFGIDATLADECVDHFRADGRFTGLIQNISGGERVRLSDALASGAEGIGDQSSDESFAAFASGDASALAHPDMQTRTEPPLDGVTGTVREIPAIGQRVFVTHGKNKAVVDQLKELLQFGKFIPVVAEEDNTPSKPVPHKVLDAMRSCSAGVIHVEGESELLDAGGNVLHKINENVLIEIGAAMALYGGNFILLVRRGIHLPSNLQGLYRCDYEGDKLDLEAAMKLLKTFNEFK